MVFTLTEFTIYWRKKMSESAPCNALQMRGCNDISFPLVLLENCLSVRNLPTRVFIPSVAALSLFS